MNASINENKPSKPLFNGQADLREKVARAIWNERRDEEDRCDTELEDLSKGHGVWYEADAVLVALARESSPVEQAEPVAWSGRAIELKTDSPVFEDVIEGWKGFEIRFNDRDYQVGDDLILLETQHTGAEMKSGAPLVFTGRQVTKRVGYIFRGPAYGLADGWIIAGFAATPPAAQPNDYHDAYRGARDDMAMWKKRALEAEESCRKLVGVLNEQNGPTHMGDPVLRAAQPITDEQLSALAVTHCLDWNDDYEETYRFNLKGLRALLSQLPAPEAVLGTSSSQTAGGSLNRSSVPRTAQQDVDS